MPSPNERSHVPVNQLLSTIKQLATRPRDMQTSGHAGWLETTAWSIRETIKRGEEFNRDWLAEVCNRMEMIARDLMDID